jgi:hypothetical protein
MFYRHVVHFTVSCYILWTFGIVRGNLAYFSRFGILYQEKSGNNGWKDRMTRLGECFLCADFMDIIFFIFAFYRSYFTG